MVPMHIASAALAVVLTASAASGSGLWDSLEEALRLSETWMSHDAREEERQTSATLLPLPKQGRSSASSAQSTRTETGTLVITVDGSPLPLADVPRAAWFAPYVREAAARGIIGGYRDEAGTPTGMFGPGDNVTVAELAKLAVTGAGIAPASCATPSRNPAAQGAWFAGVLACAEARAWTLFADATIDPLRPATRAEVLVTLLQAYGATVAPLPAGEQPFTDVSPATQFAAAIAKAKQDGIVSGYSTADGTPTGAFGPTAPVTRAEAAKITVLSLQTYVR